ncbi:MAG: IS66 family transposase [Terracidiphilus sp.]
MNKPPLAHLDVSRDELQSLLEHARGGGLADVEYEQLKAVVDTLVYLTQLVEDKSTTIARLRELLFGITTEKTAKILQQVAAKVAQANNSSVKEDESSHKAAPTAGHGRNGADTYNGARKIKVEHARYHSGNRCPGCEKGKLYALVAPGFLVRVVGQAPLAATVYELEKLRCNLCGEVFTAEPPAGVGTEKYDATAASMIALLKYGAGLPFHRLEGLQHNMEIPLPASTQWEIVEETAEWIDPVYQELIRQAAQGEVLHNDDTTMKVLSMMKENREAANKEDKSQRSGIFTSGIVSTNAGQKIALFFTGRKHAGENLTAVLAERAKELGPPIQMCDALSRNLPAEFQTVVANCIAHGRRKFVEVAARFPEECIHVLQSLGEVYKHDAYCRQQGMSPKERLDYHRTQSAPLMEKLKDWFQDQFDKHLVEPNSGLGQAITYMQNHWDRLTLFLRTAGAPLDNNICERTLKKAILHRKNALFYKTQNGAHVGDLFMSLIHTCQFCGANPFDYLTELQRHSDAVSRCPWEWMPWNYRSAIGLISCQE